MDHAERQDVLDRFQALANSLGWDIEVVAQASAYRVTGVSPDDVEYTRSDWDGSAARSNAPNPSDSDDAPGQLDQMFMAVPEDTRDAKSSWKLPFRSSPDGDVNLEAISSIIGAINGARGGVEGIGRDTLESIYSKAVSFGVDGGLYEDRDAAPDFQPANASSADFDAEATAEATGTVSFDATPDVLEASDGGTLAGIVWGAGDHDLKLGGNPTPVRVPADTVPATFEALQSDMESDEVTLGFDHPSGDSVAAQTGIVDIGKPTEAALSADEQHIVVTDSELDNPQAAEAAENGDFDDFDWSVVADVAIRRDDDGDPVMEDGRVVLDATRIRRIDAVPDGAVDAASIETDPADLPDLSDHRKALTKASAGREIDTTAAADALRATAADINEHMKNSEIDPANVDDLDDAEDMIEAAATIIDEQDDELQAAKAQANGFETVLSAHGVDMDDFEDAEAAAQAVIDEQTEDLRAEIAEFEEDLAGHDVEDVEARAEELAGRGPQDLQNHLNSLKAEKLDVLEAEQNKGRATARDDLRGKASFSGGDGSDDADADEIAQGAMDGRDKMVAANEGLDPAEYVRVQYGLEASEYDHADALQADIVGEIQGDA